MVGPHAAPTGAPDSARTSFGVGDVALAGGLTLFAGLLRWLNWQQTELIFNDGPRFLVQAQLFVAGRWEQALADPYHPLYALATAAVRLVLGIEGVGRAEWEQAALIVSIGAGAAAVAVFYVFTKSAFGRQAAWIGAALLACNPYSIEFSSDVQSEGLFQLGFLLAVAYGWSALKNQSPSLAGWAGFMSGLAYLVRPEGVGVALAAGGVGLLCWLRGQWSFDRTLAWGLALVIGLFAVMAPYLVWLRVEQGAWSLSQKKSVAALAGVVRDADARPALGLAPGAEVPLLPEVNAMRFGAGLPDKARPEVRQRPRTREEDIAHRRARKARKALEAAQEQPAKEGWREVLSHQVGALWHMLDTLVSAVRPEIVVFALLGIALARGRPGLRGQYLGAVLLVYGLLVWGLVVNYGYLSRRHILAPGLLLMGYAALAVPVVGRALLAGVRRVLGLTSQPSVRAGTALAVLLLMAAGLGKALRPRASHNLVERVAAEWVASQGDPGGPVACGKRRVAYYSGAPWFPLRKIPHSAPLAAALRLSGVRYVVADEDDVAAYGDLAKPERSGLVIVHTTRVNDETATVFEVGSFEGG